MPPQPTNLPPADLTGTAPPPEPDPQTTQAQAQSQTSALFIVLGVLLGVGMLAVLLWCACCRDRGRGRARTGARGQGRWSTQRGRSTRQNPRARTEVRIVRATTKRSSPSARRQEESPVYGAAEGFGSPVSGSVEPGFMDTFAAGSIEVQQPPMAYMHDSDAMGYLSRGFDGGLGSFYGNSSDWVGDGIRRSETDIARPLGRRAMTNLPLSSPSAETVGGNWETDRGRPVGYQSPRCETSSSSSSFRSGGSAGIRTGE
jgi:hypothetical protein